MSDRRTILSDIEDDPDQLLALGYSRVDEPSTEDLRLVWYEKCFVADDGSPRTIQITFERSITDDPDLDCNDSYSFSGITALGEGVDGLCPLIAPTLEECEELVCRRGVL